MITAKTIESERISLRVSVTDKCQMRCAYCMPEQGIASAPFQDILSYEEILDFVRHLRQKFTLERIRITGGEPLIRKDIESLVTMLNKEGIADIALTTNGELLEEKILGLKQAGLTRLNVSLDSIDHSTFAQLTRGAKLNKVLQGLKTAASCDIKPIKVNMVVIKGVNDSEIEAMLSYCVNNDYQLRYLELMPIGEAGNLHADGYISNDEVFKRLSQSFALSALDINPGETSRNYHVACPDEKTGIVGFISPVSRPFCVGCRRLRLSADGQLTGCLARQESIRIKKILARHDKTTHNEIIRLVNEALKAKKTDNEFSMSRTMAKIGG